MVKTPFHLQQLFFAKNIFAYDDQLMQTADIVIWIYDCGWKHSCCNQSHTCIMIQWKLSKADTFGNNMFVHFRQMSALNRLCLWDYGPVNWYFGKKYFVHFTQVSALEHVHFRQVLLYFSYFTLQIKWNANFLQHILIFKFCLSSVTEFRYFTA